MRLKGYTIQDLQDWSKKIEEVVSSFGLDFFPQEFEVCDRNDMLGYMAYSGMPSHYPHWSYGKAFEQVKTKYELGVTGLPYEMVINSNPSIAYLMADNSLALQLLTMAHVYAHNDFFKNNRTFQYSYPDYVIEKFKTHAVRIRGYIEDPSIGINKVEQVFDAAHALSLQCNRYLGIKKLSHEEQKKRLLEEARPKKDEFSDLHKREEYVPPELNKIPLKEEEDILQFIKDNNPFLSEWEKDILAIVAEETSYFIPQIETKIMNEGWASFWHYRIMNKLAIPKEIKLEFFKNHNQIVRPLKGTLNPYYIGFTIYEDIKKRWDDPDDEDKKEFGIGKNEGDERLFLVREADRDVSFLRQYLTKKVMMEMHFFEHGKKDLDRVVTHISDKDGWKEVKQTLLNNIGMANVPVIKIVDANYNKSQFLFLKHEFDDRELDMQYAEHTLRHLFQLWQRKVILESYVDNHLCHLSFDGLGKVEITEL